MGKFSRLGNDLYGGRKSIDFVGKRPLWYAISGVLVVAAIAIVLIRGLNLGIEFTGGTQYRVELASSQVNQDTADSLSSAITDADIEGVGVPVVTTSGTESILVQTEDLTQEEGQELRQVIADETGVDPDSLDQTDIGASLGSEVAKRAALGVGIFLVLVMLFIGFYFREPKMAAAAFVALFHDVAITIGIYALSGFQVTPSAVTGLLAILGFSLYDTVVVFDKIKENSNVMTKNRQTYSQAANLAVNQTLVRSINTGIVALIPIGAILYVSAVQLGASSLQDLALSQFVGMAVGVYSSIALAPRVLVHLKANETSVKLAEKRAKARARAEADRYAAVPSFSDDMPIADEDDDLGDDAGTASRPTSGAATRPAPTRPTQTPGSGRTVPPARGPVSRSNSAGRNQPSRKPKSQRDK